jgi:hypothetical protein
MAPLFNWLIRKPMVRVLLENTVGIDRRRPIPPSIPHHIQEMVLEKT